MSKETTILKTAEMSDAELESLNVIPQLNQLFEDAYLSDANSVDISAIATQYKDNDRQWMAISKKIWAAGHSITYDHSGSGDIRAVKVLFGSGQVNCSGPFG